MLFSRAKLAGLTVALSLVTSFGFTTLANATAAPTLSKAAHSIVKH